ncbi:CoA transferase [Acetobacteraceae bacterium H6797]|nr:CoA transferase [Acetobacteraceae bacterium H6797]
MGPLAGLRIIDMTSVVMGPYATSILGDMGADVIKLEPPDGDTIRKVGPSRSGEMGAMFLHANRSKRGIVLDLKAEEGRAALLRLAETADVLVHNLRPAPLDRLGLGWAALSAVNPRLIHLGAFGYGQDGPYAARPAYDDLIQGAAGIPALLGRSGGDGPRYVPVNIADRAVGLHAAIAILAALRHRDATGQGQCIEMPMFETMASLVLGDHLGGLSYEPPLDQGGYSRLLQARRRPCRTADGWICVLLYNEKHWRAFVALSGREDLAADPRFRDQASRSREGAAVYELLSAVMATRTTAEWEKLLDEADIPHSPMNDLEGLATDPHLAAIGFFRDEDHPVEGKIRSMRVPSRWSASQPEPSRLAPRLGEHTREVLAEAGMSPAEIEALLARGIAKAAP